MSLNLLIFISFSGFIDVSDVVMCAPVLLISKEHSISITTSISCYDILQFNYLADCYM